MLSLRKMLFSVPKKAAISPKCPLIRYLNSFRLYSVGTSLALSSVLLPSSLLLHGSNKQKRTHSSSTILVSRRHPRPLWDKTRRPPQSRSATCTSAAPAIPSSRRRFPRTSQWDADSAPSSRSWRATPRTAPSTRAVSGFSARHTSPRYHHQITMPPLPNSFDSEQKVVRQKPDFHVCIAVRSDAHLHSASSPCTRRCRTRVPRSPRHTAGATSISAARTPFTSCPSRIATPRFPGPDTSSRDNSHK